MSAAVRRAHEDVVRAMLRPLIEGRLPPGWRVVSWDLEQGLTVILEHLGRALYVELNPIDPDESSYATTRRFNVSVRAVHDPPGRPLPDDERRFVDRLVEYVRLAEVRLPVVERAVAARGSEVREITVERCLIAEGAGGYYFNPYVGCMIGCAFCYVAERADMSRAMEGAASLPWGRYVDVKVNAVEVLRREAATLPPGTVRMSPIVTDPYQPIERRYRVTRGALEVFLAHGFTPAVLTRAARVLDDLPLLRRFPVAAVGVSIPTDDDAVRAAFEPGGDPIDARLDALRRCHAAGVRTFAVIQPVLPMRAERLVEMLAPHVRAVRIDRMHQTAKHRALYEAAGALDAMSERFADDTVAALREGFARHGVSIDELDDLGALVAR